MLDERKKQLAHEDGVEHCKKWFTASVVFTLEQLTQHWSSHSFQAEGTERDVLKLTSGARV
jgi:hypothetical protein